ncbi:unnamed protein product [Laminaria digitata]
MPMLRGSDPRIRPAGSKVFKTCRFLPEGLSRADTPNSEAAQLGCLPGPQAAQLARLPGRKQKPTGQSCRVDHGVGRYGHGKVQMCTDAPSILHTPSILRVFAVYTPEIMSVLLSTPVAPPENNLLQRPLVEPSVNVSIKKMDAILETVHRRSIYTSTSHSEYTAHIESIVILRVLGVRAAPTDEILTASTWSTPQYRTLKYLKYREYPQYRIPK